MNIARLQRLADFLRTVPQEQYDQNIFASDRFKPCKSPTALGVCQSAACALGWATVIPEFHKAGLRLAWPRVGQYSDIVYWRKFVRHANMDAGRVFFGLTECQSINIFGSGRVTPKEKADEIEALIQWHVQTCVV